MTAVKKTVSVVPQHLVLQRGASLLEGIAYLGIAAIVILGAVSLLTGAFGSAESNRTSEEVTAIRTAVRKLYMGQGYGAISMNAPLVTAGAFPGTLTTATGGVVTNGWNGKVAVTGAGGTFSIEYDAVPQDVCISTLVSASGWQSIQVGSGTSITAFPISPATAETSCGTAGAAGNTMTFASI